MKYFTPELLSRIASLDDDVSVEAHHEWERAIVRSRRNWQKIKAAVPAEVQRFKNEHVCLHDAQLLSMARHGETLVMVLEPEPPSQNAVLLTFTLDGEPVIDPKALPDYQESNFVTWMYEEFDLDRHKKCWFEVLLSNGWSVKLRFRDFQFWIGQRLFPVPKARADSALPSAQPVVPQSA
jgi:hypothetical protein